MRGTRGTEEQIIAVLKEAEAGTRTADLCRRHGVSEQPCFRWKTKCGGIKVSELRRLRRLEDENNHLKRLVADLTLDNQARKEHVRTEA
jgi:putative transposase